MIYVNAVNMAQTAFTHQRSSSGIAPSFESSDLNNNKNFHPLTQAAYPAQSVVNTLSGSSHIHIDQATDGSQCNTHAGTAPRTHADTGISLEYKGVGDSHASNPTSGAHANTITSSMQSSNPIKNSMDAFPRASNKEREVLEYLATHPDATQTELSSVLLVSRSTIADYTSSLQGKGYLKREGTRRDGRWIVKGIA